MNGVGMSSVCRKVMSVVVARMDKETLYLHKMPANHLLFFVRGVSQGCVIVGLSTRQFPQISQ